MEAWSIGKLKNKNLLFIWMQLQSKSTFVVTHNTQYLYNRYVYFVFVLIVFVLLSRESEGGAIFWTKPHPPSIWPFPSYRWFLTSFLIIICCSKSRNKDNCCRELYSMTQQRDFMGKMKKNHAVVNTRSP